MKLKSLVRNLIVISLVVFNSYMAVSQEEALTDPTLTKEVSSEHKPSHKEDHHHPHHVAIAAGGAYIGGSNYFSLGLDYEYRLPFLNRLFGILVLGELTLADPHNLGIVAGGIVIHPFYDFKLLATVGTEIEGSATAFLFRAGAGYDIHIGDRFAISPTVYMDLVHGHIAWVYVAGFGVGF